MKSRLLILAFLAIGCRSNQNENQAISITTANGDFDWMLGEWQKIDTVANITLEHWKKISANEYQGNGFVLNDLDTVWQEKMLLLKKDSCWSLIVSTPGNTDQVVFTESEKTAEYFKVENLEHDFPNYIEYWFLNDHLKARVSSKSEDYLLEFDFEKIN